MEASSKLCEEAQSCFSFVDQEGLVDATADVCAAVSCLLREMTCHLLWQRHRFHAVVVVVAHSAAAAAADAANVVSYVSLVCVCATTERGPH